MQSYRKDNSLAGLDKLQMISENIPTPQRGEVLVQVKATSINFIDVATLERDNTDSTHGNHIPLSDGAGEIIATGSDVARFQVGDQVMGNFNQEWFGGKRPNYIKPYGAKIDGWLTEYKVLNAELLVSIPSHLTYEQAATLPCAAVTAWSALHGPSTLVAGDSVLTLGSGGVSVFALQLAKAMGLRVIATTSSETKAKRLTELGADHVINYKTTLDWDQSVKELTNGTGVDRVVEVVGPSTLHLSLQSASTDGEIALVGFLGNSNETFSYFDLFGKAKTRSVSVGSRNDFEAMTELIEKTQLIPVVDRVFPFAEAKNAFEHLKSQNHFGKVVISHHND